MNARFCNQGIAVDNAAAEITLAPELNMVSAQIPFSNLGDQRFRFDIGTLAPGQCRVFGFVVNVDCDMTDLGQTLCMEADLFPNDGCGSSANYTGPTLRLSGECDDDNSLIKFNIQNVGEEAMSAPAGYTVIEDDLIMPQLSNEIQLDADESLSLIHI